MVGWARAAMEMVEAVKVMVETEQVVVVRVVALGLAVGGGVVAVRGMVVV